MTTSKQQYTATIDVPATALSRRRFLQTVTSGVAAAGLTGCGKAPPEKIVPYVSRPPEVVPGVSRQYATTATRGGYGIGLLAESHEGRPTKLEGHPDHPASVGRTLAPEQAEILGLYDADRARATLHDGHVDAWSAFEKTRSPARVPARGDGVHLLLEPTSSPLVVSLLARLKEQRPACEVHFLPYTSNARFDATRRVLGGVYETRLHLDEAKTVVDLDSDFLTAMPMSIRWAFDFAAHRAGARPDSPMNRLYSIEPVMTVTGSTADHRLALQPSAVPRAAAALLALVGGHLPDRVPQPVRDRARPFAESLDARTRTWLDALAKELVAHRGASALVAGDRLPATAHAIAIALNDALGNAGSTVEYGDSPLAEIGTDSHDVRRLLDALDAGGVEALFVLGPNPGYDLPHDARFPERFRKAKERVHLTWYENETSANAAWIIPRTHFLEEWGDAKAQDGTVSFRQPLIEPLFGGLSVERLLCLLAGIGDVTVRDLLEELWIPRLGGRDGYRDALQRGLIPESATAPRTARVDWDAVGAALNDVSPAAPESLELDLRPDPRFGDGRLSNNPWLHELPDPVTKLVWDNAVFLSPDTASELGIETGMVLRVKHGPRVVVAPAFVCAGMANATLSVWTGYGRDGAESVARGIGADVGPIRTTERPWLVRGVDVDVTERRHRFARTQHEFEQHGRGIALYRTLDQWSKHPEFARHQNETPPDLMPNRVGPGAQWGLAVDLGRCTGCSACVVACQAENNIPTVGKEMVALGREMHWLRIDTYHEGSASTPKVLMQPMLCQHCEKAPCEYVCPVNATVHSPDGLNEMVYNRCVGTRFCSNNCPYKVRRFNWFDWNQSPDEPRKMAFNPNVTVRARGVMEKCTYCVQRIRRAEIAARAENRQLRSEDVVTACAQACPTNALVFGLVSEPESEVSKLHGSARTYAVLNELNTRPRTRYLARIANTNQEIPG